MDLATGLPFDDGTSAARFEDQGIVIVRWGHPVAGLAGATMVLQPGHAHFLSGFRFGHALAAGDFNGDGRDDLAVGVPGFGAEGDTYDYGGVRIYYGSVFEFGETEFFHSGSAGFPDPPGPFDELGHALAAGDFDGDGFDDLAIGAPAIDAEEHGVDDGGAVVVLHGSADGLMKDGAAPFQGYLIHQDDPPVPDGGEDPDDFGWALAAGNFDGDLEWTGSEIRPYDDLAMAAPGEDGIGAVMVMMGSPFGLIFADSDYIGEGDLGFPGEAGDQFGYSLAAGNFDGDEACHEIDTGGPFPIEACTPLDDLVIGTPHEDLGFANERVNAGQITVLFGLAGGYFDRARARQLHQGNIHGGDFHDESGDLFGLAVATGDFDDDGHDDLAIGHPGEHSISGAVTLVMGGPGGFSLRHHLLIPGWTFDVPPAPSQALSDAGRSLATGDFDGDGHADLVIGQPFRDREGLADVGAATLLYGQVPVLFADGFETGNFVYWSSRQP